MTKIVTVV